MESLLDNITGFSITGDTGLELDEMDLHAFLGEPEAEGYTTQVRHCRQKPMTAKKQYSRSSGF